MARPALAGRRSPLGHARVSQRRQVDAGRHLLRLAARARPNLRILVLAAARPRAQDGAQRQADHRAPSADQASDAGPGGSVGGGPVHRAPAFDAARRVAARARHHGQHHGFARGRGDLRRRRGAEHLQYARQARGPARTPGGDQLHPGAGRPAALRRDPAQLLFDLRRGGARGERRNASIPRRLRAVVHSDPRRGGRSRWPERFSPRSRSFAGEPGLPSSTAR